jgi:hypothetical protein
VHTSDPNNIMEMIIMNKTKKKRKKSRKPFTKGELNYVVDAVVHPLYRLNKGFRVLDVTLHGLIEKDLVKTTEKFVQFNLPAIIKKNPQNNRIGHAPAFPSPSFF